MSCLFAARLAPVAHVTLIDTWNEAIAAIRARGILFEDVGKTQTVRVQAELLETPIEPADLAVVLVKSWQTASIARYLPGSLNAEGVAISLQNGLGNVEQLGAKAFPGSTTEAAALLGPGHVKVGGSGSTHMVSPAWVIDLFRSAGFECNACSPSEAQSLIWGKLCVSCGINGLTALLRIPNGELLARPTATDLMIRAAMECASVASAMGINLPFADTAAHVKQVAEKSATNRSSMLQDILRNAPTECDAINGAVVREGLRIGIRTPVNKMLWSLIRATVQGNRSERRQ
jgi:2-dehydropantoate 2-reductase